MFVKMWMTTDVMTVDADTPILEARTLMKEQRIRRLPVLKHGRLAGIVTEGDIQEASPSDATSLSIWELNYLLAKTRVADIMTRRNDLCTIGPEDPIEKAALLMRERKISGLPVIDGERLVGIITESDVFEILLNLMGIQREGSRVTIALENQPGRLMPAIELFRDHNINILSIVTCEDCRHALEGAEDLNVVVIRIEGDDYRPIVHGLKAAGIRVLDART